MMHYDTYREKYFILQFTRKYYTSKRQFFFMSRTRVTKCWKKTKGS